MKEISIKNLILSFPELLKFYSGNENEIVTEITSIERSHLKSLTFINKTTESLGQLGVVITTPKLSSTIQNTKCLLVTQNLELALTEISNKVFPIKHFEFKPQIHKSVIFHESAKIGKNVFIGPNVVIGENCFIGDEVYIGANSVIEENSIIGTQSRIEPLVFIGWSSQIGRNVWIGSGTCIGTEGFGFFQNQSGESFKIPQRGIVIIEDNVEIQSNCSIARGSFDFTKIGEGSKLDNLIHIAHNCKIGKHCLITAHFSTGGSSTIGDHCMFGGRTTLKDHTHVTNKVLMGGMSAIRQNITESGQYSGDPAMPIKEHFKILAVLKYLPEMHKSIIKIKSKLGLD